MNSMPVQIYVPAIECLLTHNGMREEDLLARCDVVTGARLAKIRAEATRAFALEEEVADLAQAFGVRPLVLVDKGAFETYTTALDVLREEGQPHDAAFCDLALDHRYAARQSTYEQSEYSVPRSKQEIRELYYAYRGW